MLAIAIVSALAVLAAMAPATAAVTGGGTVVGTVTINGSGIPTATQPQAATTYSFGAVNITGTFRSANGGLFAGTIKIPAGVTGGSPSENTLGGKGSVNFFSFSGTGVGTISGTCSGTFKRNVSVVTVKLSCSVSVAGKPAQSAKVVVNANFTPTNGNGLTTPVKSANFAGVYRST
jgi:hypothetical protein